MSKNNNEYGLHISEYEIARRRDKNVELMKKIESKDHANKKWHIGIIKQQMQLRNDISITENGDEAQSEKDAKVKNLYCKFLVDMLAAQKKFIIANDEAWIGIKKLEEN